MGISICRRWRLASVGPLTVPLTRCTRRTCATADVMTKIISTSQATKTPGLPRVNRLDQTISAKTSTNSQANMTLE